LVAATWFSCWDRTSRESDWNLADKTVGHGEFGLSGNSWRIIWSLTSKSSDTWYSITSSHEPSLEEMTRLSRGLAKLIEWPLDSNSLKSVWNFANDSLCHCLSSAFHFFPESCCLRWRILWSNSVSRWRSSRTRVDELFSLVCGGRIGDAVPAYHTF